MDRRIQKTRAAIFSAFDKLIQKNAYAKISVQNIIDEANIGRSTFYEHFETKDELLRQKCTDLFEHIFSPHGMEKTHSFSEKTTFEQKITHILYHLLDDKKVVKGILSSESGEIFFQYFRNHLYNVVVNTNIAVNEVPQEYLYDHIISSFINTVRWWVERDYPEAPEVLSGYYINVVPTII